MKKIIIIPLLIIVTIIIGVTIFISQKNLDNNTNDAISNEKREIEPKSEAYYESFRKKCEGFESPNCCLSSVNNAEQANSFIYERGTPLSEKICPDGFELNKNRCIDSYAWCSAKN